MKTEMLGQEKNVVTVKIEFEAEEFAASLDKTVQDLAEKIKVPGFRKGRIPRKVIEMRLGKDKLYAESLEKMLPSAIDQVQMDYELVSIGTPSLNVLNMSEGEPLVCEVVFEVFPEVELPEFGDIEVEKPRANVTDDMVEKAIEDLKKQLATLNPVDRPAGGNDVISITSSPIEGGTPQTDEVILASPALNEKLRDALLGKSKGDRFSFESDETHGTETGSQEKTTYDIMVNEVKEYILPDMTPEFYKRLGDKVETEEDFKKTVRALIFSQIEIDNLVHVSRTAVDMVVARSDLEVPDSLVTRQVERLKQRDTDNCKKHHNMSLEDYLRDSSITPSQYEQQLRVQAMQDLRRELVMDAVGKKFNVEVDKQDIEEEIANIVRAQKVDPIKIQIMLRKDKNRLNQLISDLRYRKSTAEILRNIKIKEIDQEIDKSGSPKVSLEIPVTTDTSEPATATDTIVPELETTVPEGVE